MLINLLDNAAIQGLLYGGAAVGLAIAFRVLRYPDLTADGSLLIGAVVAAAGLKAGVPWGPLLLLSGLAGAVCGCFTGVIHYLARVDKLLSGILTSMICYSLAFHLLGLRPTVSLSDQGNLFRWSAHLDGTLMWAWLPHPATLSVGVIWTGLILTTLAFFLQSDLGLHLRTVGTNPRLLQAMGRKPAAYVVLGLAASNSLIASSGSLIAFHQQFVDVNMGVGMVVVLTAGLLIGERAVRFVGLNPKRQPVVRAASGVVGMVLYYFLYLTVLRLSVMGWLPWRIEPSDIKLVSAVLVIIVSFTAGAEQTFDEEHLPL